MIASSAYSGALSQDLCHDHESVFLSWFAATGNPMAESLQRLKDLEYFQFSSMFTTSQGRRCGAFGRSQNRRLAALKCAAEFVERKVMLEYFEFETSVPKEFHTSNGWAVHFDPEEAKRRSYLEALERHLLLRSFLENRWHGFRLFKKIESGDDLEIYFLNSSYVAGGWISGLVAVKSPLYDGLSFGYCIGRKDDLQQAAFWEAALFEAIDKILSLKGKSIDLSKDPHSWIRAETKRYLEEPFDLSNLGAGVSEREIDLQKANSLCFDVSGDLGLMVPLYAGFSFGEELLPLFHPNVLGTKAKSYLQRILDVNNAVFTMPERHPIL